MLSLTNERPDIEPMLIRVNGANDFVVNKTESYNFAQLKALLNEYQSLAESSGSRAIFVIHTGKLSAAAIYPILVKFHSAGMTTIVFTKPKMKAPVIKPPVNRIPASPHRR